MVWDRNSSVIVLLSQVDGEVSMTIVNRSILRSISYINHQGFLKDGVGQKQLCYCAAVTS